MSTIVIDPINRIEGHLKVESKVEGGKVKEARTSGTLFRGFEIFLQGRSPLDAPIITQRVCGFQCRRSSPHLAGQVSLGGCDAGHCQIRANDAFFTELRGP